MIADFDGDEMNIHFARTYSILTDVLVLLNSL